MDNITSDQNERMTVRRKIIETLNIFLKLPKYGEQRVSIYDMSDTGLSFCIPPDLSINKNASITAYFFINDYIKIPLKLTIINIYDEFGFSKAGCVVNEGDTEAHDVYNRFVSLLHSLVSFTDI